MKTAYQEQGFESRKEYLESLASEYGHVVYDLASMLGAGEDFDGLISSLEDYDEGF